MKEGRADLTGKENRGMSVRDKILRNAQTLLCN